MFGKSNKINLPFNKPAICIGERCPHYLNVLGNGASCEPYMELEEVDAPNSKERWGESKHAVYGTVCMQVGWLSDQRPVVALELVSLMPGYEVPRSVADDIIETCEMPINAPVTYSSLRQPLDD